MISNRTARWLAWSTFALSIVFVLLSLVLSALFNDLSVGQTVLGGQESFDYGLLLVLGQLAYGFVGALVAARRPANPIGWIFCAVSLVQNLALVAEVYARHAVLTGPDSLPGGAYAAWLVSWAQGPEALGVLALIFLIFPNGQLLSPRWRPVAWLAIFTPLLDSLSAFRPGPLENFPAVNNPLGFQVIAGAAEIVRGVDLVLFLVLPLAAAVSLVLRFVRSRGEERQQLKWFAGSALLVACVFLLGPFIWFSPLSGTLLWPILFFLSISSIPVSMGVAILRYRLYDIDVIIRRTLIYSTVTVLLLLFYFGSVIALQGILRRLTGQESDFAIILSTLAIAALFNPLRSRVQNMIDNRFYRPKYDTAQILTAFGVTARDEVDLNRLTDELVTVVEQTMQPTHVNLWLRETRPMRK